MSSSDQTIVQFPISGSDLVANQPPSVYQRTTMQVSSASVRTLAHPGGGMTGSLLLAPRNLNRTRFTILNSGSLALGLGHGHSFNPNAALGPSGTMDNIVLGTAVLQGNQPTTPSIGFDPPLPCYTGPLFVGWIGSGTLSGSTAVMTEFTDER